MYKTIERNAVIVYIAIKDKQLAIFADAGIYEKVGQQFWDERLELMLQHFNKEHYVDGIANVVKEVGEALQANFPFQKNDVNELPDDIVFGK